LVIDVHAQAVRPRCVEYQSSLKSDFSLRYVTGGETVLDLGCRVASEKRIATVKVNTTEAECAMTPTGRAHREYAKTLFRQESVSDEVRKRA